ncbi:MAG: glutathione S-transferase family protein [Deltaproteobacteria bacterium]|nr:glutathione S-transferase family protein [Deltaproteobacteria bacterium]MBI3387285.1 glutathione S-transferase family protein [Deltaproteobacteria bacterium]
MKLYNMNLSNFASKCRLAIYEKNAPVDIVAIPGGELKSPEYLKVYPLGKTPALEVNGQIIGESEVIVEYFEEKFPDKPLLPKDPESRARSRGFGRFHDLYLEPPIRALFPQVAAKEKDQKLIADKLAEIKTRFDQLEGMLSSGPYALGSAFTLADCAVIPTMFFANLLLPMLGGAAPTEGRPKLAAWWAKVQERPAVQKVLGEQQQALMEMQQRR